MAHKQKGQLAASEQWWKHLRRYWKRKYWKAERTAQAKDAEQAHQDFKAQKPDLSKSS